MQHSKFTLDRSHIAPKILSDTLINNNLHTNFISGKIYCYFKTNEVKRDLLSVKFAMLQTYKTETTNICLAHS